MRFRINLFRMRGETGLRGRGGEKEYPGIIADYKNKLSQICGNWLFIKGRYYYLYKVKGII
uniref:Uncharacterized protein n=1 Tax=Salmonella enterica subsp. salamae TaxID=59202 RepID=I3W489_SALER|nr:hypothetical protein [Salmonella enterica subsp. salamae]